MPAPGTTSDVIAKREESPQERVFEASGVLFLRGLRRTLRMLLVGVKNKVCKRIAIRIDER